MEQIEQEYLKEISIIRRVGQTIKWGGVTLMAGALTTTGVETAVYGDSKRTVFALGAAMLSAFGLMVGVGLESIADHEALSLLPAQATPGQIEQNGVN